MQPPEQNNMYIIFFHLPHKIFPKYIQTIILYILHMTTNRTYKRKTHHKRIKGGYILKRKNTPTSNEKRSNQRSRSATRSSASQSSQSSSSVKAKTNTKTKNKNKDQSKTKNT
jgi:hypothetical protein